MFRFKFWVLFDFQVYNGLKGHEEFDVYQRDEIPDYFHYKGHRLVQDLLVVAKPNYFIRGMQNSKQIPRDPPDVNFWGGVHGYANMTEMRTIFFAKGPGIVKLKQISTFSLLGLSMKCVTNPLFQFPLRALWTTPFL